MCVRMCLAECPPILILGNQERFIDDFQKGKAVPLLQVQMGLLFSPFFLKYDHNDLGGMTALVNTAILPNDLHLAFLHWD